MGLIKLGARHAWDNNGDPVSGAKKSVFFAGTTTPATTYSDPELTIPQTFPILADAEGIFPQSYAADGSYKIHRRLCASGYVTLSHWFPYLIRRFRELPV